MNYKHTIKKQSYIIAISAILLAIAVAGTSYALFFQVDSNSNNQVVETGSLAVTYGDNSKAISATELLPMSDTDALDSETLVSTIYVNNTGSLPADYTLTIGNDIEAFEKDFGYKPTNELLDHQYIRVSVNKIHSIENTEMIVSPTKLSDLTIYNPTNDEFKNDNTMYELHTGELQATLSGNGNSDITYAIKVWIASDAPVDIIGKLVYLKVDVNSTVDEPKTAENA